MEIILLGFLLLYLIPLFRGKSNPGKTFMKFLFLGGVLFISGAIFLTTVDSSLFGVGVTAALLILAGGYISSFFW